MDARQVGSSARRRMSAPSSHLAMAVGAPPSERRIEGFTLPGSGHMPGVPDDYRPGDPNLLAGADNDEFGSEVSAVMQNEPHPGRTGVTADESAGARLTISPSMKTPIESPAPTQGEGRVVKSFRGRSFSGFQQGQNEVYSG